jgi:hypothetical protein
MTICSPLKRSFTSIRLVRARLWAACVFCVNRSLLDRPPVMAALWVPCQGQRPVSEAYNQHLSGEVI